MLRSLPYICVILALAGAEASPAAEPAASPVQALLEACARAHGGPALEQLGGERRTGSLVRGTLGRVPFEILGNGPNRWLWVQTFAWGDRVAFGCDGEQAWVQDGGGGAAMSAAQRLDLQLLLDARAPARLRELFPVMEITASGELEGRQTVTASATSLDGVSRLLRFDRESGLLLAAGDMRFEDHRQVNLVTRPFRILLGNPQEGGRGQIRMELDEIQAGVDLEASRFAPPSSILPSVPPPLYTARTVVAVSPEDLDACVGTYRHPIDPERSFTVTRQDLHLMFESPDQRPVEIKPQSATHYFMQFVNLDFVFLKNEIGSVTHLEIGAAGRTLRAPRVDSAGATQEAQ